MGGIVFSAAFADVMGSFYTEYVTIFNVSFAMTIIYLITFLTVLLSHGFGSSFVRLGNFDISVDTFIAKYGAVNICNKQIFRKFCLTRLPYSVKRAWQKCDKKGENFSDSRIDSLISHKLECSGTIGIVVYFTIYIIGVILLTTVGVVNGVEYDYTAYISIAIITGALEMVALSFQLYYLSNKYSCIGRDIFCKLRAGVKYPEAVNNFPDFNYSFSDILVKARREPVAAPKTDNVGLLSKMIDGIVKDGVSTEILSMLVDGLKSLQSTGYVSPADELRIGCIVHDIEGKVAVASI